MGVEHRAVLVDNADQRLHIGERMRITARPGRGRSVRTSPCGTRLMCRFGAASNG
jgi:hypothetical protein